jgi:hypothetical protein
MLFVYIGLIAFGCYLIYNEKKLIKFERETFNKIKEVIKR